VWICIVGGDALMNVGAGKESSGAGATADELSSLFLLGGAESGTGPPGFLEDGEGLTSTRRLRKLVSCWVYLDEILLPKIPKDHPFLKAQEKRMRKVKDTLLIDLRSALKEVWLQGDEGKCLEVMGLFADLGTESDAVKALKESRQ